MPLISSMEKNITIRGLLWKFPLTSFFNQAVVVFGIMRWPHGFAMLVMRQQPACLSLRSSIENAAGEKFRSAKCTIRENHVCPSSFDAHQSFEKDLVCIDPSRTCRCHDHGIFS